MDLYVCMYVCVRACENKTESCLSSQHYFYLNISSVRHLVEVCPHSLFYLLCSFLLPLPFSSFTSSFHFSSILPSI